MTGKIKLPKSFRGIQAFIGVKRLACIKSQNKQSYRRMTSTVLCMSVEYLNQDKLKATVDQQVCLFFQNLSEFRDTFVSKIKLHTIICVSRA